MQLNPLFSFSRLSPTLLQEVRVDPVRSDTALPGRNDSDASTSGRGSPRIDLRPVDIAVDRSFAARALRKHSVIVKDTIDGLNFQLAARKFQETVEEPASGVHGSTQTDESEFAAGVSGGDSSGGEFFANKVMAASLEWANLVYTVSLGKKKTRTILSSVSGHVKSGHLLAVMGPTGCGKSSLLNALAGRLEGGHLDGSIHVNGQPRSRSFKAIAAYVMQDDVLLHNLTVKETFLTAAHLRLPPAMGLVAKQRVVDGIITALGLTKAANTQIGNSFVRGVSGGERKRCNIGVELIANPSIIFLDEPTSGLDAFQAQNVMESLWKLAQQGRTVLSTIHQPRSSIYSMFDRLLLMSEGMIMFSGPAADAVDHLSKWGFSCPAKYNPADFFLDMVSMDYRTPGAEQTCRERVRLLASVYQDDATPRTALASAPEHSQHFGAGRVGFETSWVRQFGILVRRAWLQSARDMLPLAIALVQTIIIAIMLGVLYSNLKKDQKGVQDRIGILFFIATNSAFGNLMRVVGTFPVEKAVVNRERASKSYRVSPYFLSKVIAELPSSLLVTLIFSSIVYWMSHLNPGALQFARFFALMVLEALAAQGLGTWISAACRNEKLALTVAPAVSTVLMMFGGFYANTDTIPVWVRWVQYLSHLYWIFMGLSINEFRGACCWSLAAGGTSSGDQILETLGFGSWALWAPFLGLGALALVYNFLGYLTLRRNRPRFLPLTSSKQQ